MVASTYKDEDMTTLNVGSSEKSGDLPFKEVFHVWPIVFTAMRRGFKVQNGHIL